MSRVVEPGPEFGRLFDSFQHTAFRLEVRERYNSPKEAESLEKFLAGEPDDLTWHQNWLAMLREATTAGRRFSRVRVVSVPLSDYSRFGVWISQFASQAGDDIRYLPRDAAQGSDLPDMTTGCLTPERWCGCTSVSMTASSAGR